MDIILPDMDGRDVVKALAHDQVTKHIPVIFTSNTVDPEKDKGHEVIEVEGKEYRAFAKPLHHRKLLSTLRKEINKIVHHNI
jgi:CheY-like chemotaxis protein